VSRTVRIATERLQLPVLIVGGKAVGGLNEVRAAVDSGELFEMFSSLAVSFRREEVTF
jgi:hypothetical protein